MDLETLQNYLDKHPQIEQVVDKVEIRISKATDAVLERLGETIRKSLLAGANLRDKADDVVSDMMFNPFEPISEMTIKICEIARSETAQAIPGLIAAIPGTTVRLTKAVIEELVYKAEEIRNGIRKDGLIGYTDIDDSKAA